jgi:hypothetical protein
VTVYRAVVLSSLAVALVLAGITIAPGIRVRWFADPEPVQLIIAVADNTQETRPLDMEIRAAGEDPWKPDFSGEVPADHRFLGFYEVGEVHNVVIDIYSEPAVALNFGFRMTEDMKPVETGNMIVIDVRDHEVLVSGPALSDGDHRFDR